MKKILAVLCMAIIFGCSIASAKDSYSHDASVLPEAAKSVISKNFKSNVTVVKIDKDFGKVSEYEVVLSDGSEITFDSRGNWKDVEVGNNMNVPSGFVIKPISDYVKNNHKNTRIVGIEKNRNNYEVELSNGIDIKFDLGGKFLKYEK